MSVGVWSRSGVTAWMAREKRRCWPTRSFSGSMTARCSNSPLQRMERRPNACRSKKWFWPRTSASRIQRSKAHSMSSPTALACSGAIPRRAAGMLALGSRPVPTAFLVMVSTVALADQSLAMRSAARRWMTSRSREVPSRLWICGPRQWDREPRKAPASREASGIRRDVESGLPWASYSMATSRSGRRRAQAHDHARARPAPS